MGDSARVAHCGPWAGGPLSALQGTAHSRAHTDPLPTEYRCLCQHHPWHPAENPSNRAFQALDICSKVLGDVGAEGSPWCSAFSRWESVSSPGKLRGELMQLCRGSGDPFPGCPHWLQTSAQGAASPPEWVSAAQPRLVWGECPCTLLRVFSLQVL